MTASELKALRHSLGWSQERLAEALGVTQPAVSLWESGIRAIPGPVERLLARIVADLAVSTHEG